MTYHETAPAAELEPVVAAYWFFEIAEQHPGCWIHTVVPDGCISLAYCPRAAEGGRWLNLVGPRVQALQVPVYPGERFWGARFQPHSAGPFLGLSPWRLREAHMPLSQLLPELAAELWSQLELCASAGEAALVFDRTLGKRLAGSAPLDGRVEAALRQIIAGDGEVRIRDLAHQVRLCERQLQRRFRSAVGLTPKEFVRIRRLRASAYRRLNRPPEPWAHVAADLGYTDQAHLIHEFRELLGMPPTAFDRGLASLRISDYRPG